MDAIYAALGIIAVALISGLFTLLVARRTKSGKIDTSEAASLWVEGNAMRKELRDEVVFLKGELKDAITAINNLNTEIRKSRAETAKLREDNLRQNGEMQKLLNHIEELHKDVRTSNSLSIGALADNAETRRILQIPKEERTYMEKLHLATAHERVPEESRPYISEEDREYPDESEGVSHA